jgi:hypothetical protein
MWAREEVHIIGGTGEGKGKYRKKIMRKTAPYFPEID